jgi:hypothetical protein
MKQLLERNALTLAASLAVAASLCLVTPGCGGGDSDADDNGAQDNGQAQTGGDAQNATEENGGGEQAELDPGDPVDAVYIFASRMAEGDFNGAAEITNPESPARPQLEQMQSTLDGAEERGVPSVLIAEIRRGFTTPYQNIDVELVDELSEDGQPIEATVKVTLRNANGETLKVIESATLTNFPDDSGNLWLLTLTDEFTNVLDRSQVSDIPQPPASEGTENAEPERPRLGPANPR